MRQGEGGGVGGWVGGGYLQQLVHTLQDAGLSGHVPQQPALLVLEPATNQNAQPNAHVLITF